MSSLSKYRSAAALKQGEKAIIRGFSDQWLSLKLLEMGCLPGSEISLHCKAPLGDPVCFTITGYCLAMRKAEAATILVE